MADEIAIELRGEAGRLCRSPRPRLQEKAAQIKMVAGHSLWFLLVPASALFSQLNLYDECWYLDPRPCWRQAVLNGDHQRTHWPRLMTVRTAAAYCDERSPYSFRRAVGRLWPHPIKVPGKGERWLKEDLDLAIDRLASKDVRDAADVL
jgi:hypothetical protein